MKYSISILLIIVFLLNSIITNACSMYKITHNGKTIVGNNEDWISPNSQFWYENSSEDKYGVMYMGQLNNFAQGAINEAGLMFDGFANPELAIENSEGKLNISIGDAIRHIMQTMNNVEDVKNYIATINLSSLSSSMIVFVEKSGKYLIVEGDELIIGNETEKAFSNFYYSQISSLKEVDLDTFQNGLKFTTSTDGKASLDYCGEAMKNFSSPNLFATQYSTVYDLSTLTVRVYLFHDYSQYIDIDLKKELAKGNHKTIIAELFPKNTYGYKHYKKYNDVNKPTRYLEEFIGENPASEEELANMGFNTVFNAIGYEWLKDKNNPKAAIEIFKYGIQLMPNDADLYDSLGEAFFYDKDWDNSIKNYKKSLSLNSENKNAQEMLKKAIKNKG